jgi:hypothetical protein
MVKHTPLQEQVLSAHVINSSSTFRNHVFREMQPGISVICSKQNQIADRKNTEWTRGSLLLTLQKTYEGESSPVNTSLHHNSGMEIFMLKVMSNESVLDFILLDLRLICVSLDLFLDSYYAEKKYINLKILHETKKGSRFVGL